MGDDGSHSMEMEEGSAVNNNNDDTPDEDTNDDGNDDGGGRRWWERGQLEAMRDGDFDSVASEDEIDDG